MAILVCASIVLAGHFHLPPGQQAVKHARQDCFQIKELQYVYLALLVHLPVEIRQLCVCCALQVISVHRIHHPRVQNVGLDFILQPKDLHHARHAPTAHIPYLTHRFVLCVQQDTCLRQ
jgi:hypothetical protein